MKFLKDSGFLEKFPEWETFESDKEVVPQDILDAIIFTISVGRSPQGSYGEEKLKDSLKRLEEDARWLANIDTEVSPAVLDTGSKPITVTFEIPMPEEIKHNLSNNHPPHNFKPFKCNLYVLRRLLENAEWRIANYLKEDVFPEMKLYRNICIRTVEYISEMLPGDLGYDIKDLKEKYTQALDNYMDTLAWEYLGTDERFSTHYFIDCWNIDSAIYTYIEKKYYGKDNLKLLSGSIKASLNGLKMPHIRVFYYDWEECLFTNGYNGRYKSDDIFHNYDNIVDYYLKLVACDSKNIRQVMWAIEGKKMQKDIEIFFRQLYLSGGFFKKLKYQYKDIAEPILATILEGFNNYFETMPPGNLWLKLSDAWNMLDFEGLLKECYPLANGEDLFARKKSLEDDSLLVNSAEYIKKEGR